MDHPSNDQQARDVVAGRSRKPYLRPVLTEYGSVAKLTQGSLTQGNDGPMGKTRNPCL